MVDPRPLPPPDPSFPGILRHARVKAEETLREYRAVAGALSERHQTLLTDRQRGLMSNLLRRVVDDIEGALHQLLLARGEGEDWVAREAMEAVHRRGASGAYERLTEAGALNELSLVEAIIHRLLEHQLDRALRRPSAQGWSVAGGYDDETLSAILAPDGPHAVQEALEAYAVERSLRIDGYGNPVIDAAELDGALVERLHWLVAGALRETLGTAGEERARIDALLEESVAAALHRVRAVADAGTRAAVVAKTMDDSGLLDCELALTTLRCAEIPLFEAMLIRLTGLRPVLLRRLLYETGGESLAVAMRALGASSEQFLELYTLSRRARTAPRVDETADLGRIAAFFESVREEAAREAQFYWQRHPAMLSALWRLGQGEADGAADLA